MTTILCISDTHVSHASPRWAECQRILTWFAEEACVDADLVIHCGDLFDRAASTKDREFAHWWVGRITSRCPLIVVRGNHDPVGEIAMLAAHASEHPCHTAETPGVIVEAGVVVQCLPWPRTAELASRGLSDLSLDEAAREALRAVLLGLASEADSVSTDPAQGSEDVLPIVLATHALISGAVTSHGQPLVGGELSLGLTDLALAAADVVIAGHIHAPQEWEYGGRRTAYCGSPFRTSFGESEAKSVVRLDVVESGRLAFSRVATPAQRMILQDADWQRGEFVWYAHAEVPAGSQVRLRYTVAAEHREAARTAATALRDGWLAAGAERVVVEPEVVATSTARAPEIATATTVREQLETLWTARADRPANAEGVLRGLAEIEQEG